MDILATIMDERRAAVVAARAAVPEDVLRRAAAGRVHHSLVAALRAGSGTRIVAESKKASPSAGLLRPDYRPAEIAATYARAGATGVSVLTEPRHFQGAGEHLHAVRAVVELPVLRKDFMCDPYQVCEAAAWGADVVLVIVAALSDAQMRELYDAACACGLDVLAEAHTRDELARALALEEAVVGVNSRDLKTLRTDLRTARELAGEIPAQRLSIAESGIRSRADIESLEECGYDGFLIGEALMATGDPAAKLAELSGRGGGDSGVD